MSVASPPGEDIRRSDLAVAAAFTVAVFGSTVFALAHARLSHRAELPLIDPGQAIPIAVRPVADLAAGGSSSGAAVPNAWRRKPPRARTPAAAPVPDQQPQPESAVVPRTNPTPSTSPHKPLPAKPTAEQPPPSEPPPEQAVDPPIENALPDVEPDSDPEAAGEGAGAGEGSSPIDGEGAGGGIGDGQGEGAGEGEGTDPLLARAIAFYRARLVAWFSARFRVSNSGLSSEQLTKYRVRVNIEIGDDLRIVDYHVLASDHPAFEQAARHTLDKLRGESLPPPPENYPGAVQHHLSVTFTCAEDTCD